MSASSTSRRRFEKRVAIVTGSGRGIGRAYALGLAGEGARVCVAEINESDAEETAALIRAQGGEAISVVTDVADESSTLAMAERTVDAFGGIDYLVNNAGIYGDRTPWDVLTDPIDYWNLSIAVNLTSVVLCTRAVVPHMIERGGGAIVNQSSAAAFKVGGGAGVQYGLTKMGVVYLTSAFAKRLGQHDIRVNAVAPGLTDTAAYQKQVVSKGKEAALLASIPIQRRGTTEDVTAGVLYLLSEDARYVTGQALSIDGGMIMRL